MLKGKIHGGRSHESPMIPLIMRAVDNLLESEDNEGCSADLTVVGAEPVDELRRLRNLRKRRH